MLKRSIALIAISALSYGSPGFAQDRAENPAQPYQCEDSTVSKTGFYFENTPTSGVYATFRSKLGVSQFKDATAAIVDRSASSNSVLGQFKVGDRVQVCLISTPAKNQYCDPTKDSRGRYYRVYNYRLRAAYSGTNANHLCGGA